MIDYITNTRNVKKICSKSKDGLYIDSWEKFDETSLPDKEAFYSE